MKWSAERVLAILLRVAGCVEALALFPTVMPRSWMAAVHQFIGLGAFPQAPIVEYLARTTSALYAAHGGLMLVLSLDVRRYLPVVFYVAATSLALGVLAIVVDASLGMPWWWTLGEGPPLLVFGALVLWSWRRVGAPRDGTPAADS